MSTKPDRDERKLRFATARAVAEELARATKADSALERLRLSLIDAIARQEREHRAFGKRLLRGRVPRMATVPQVIDLFVARAVLEAPWTDLSAADPAPMRSDYQLGGMLGNHPAVRSQLRPSYSAERAANIVESLSYADLVAPNG